MLQPLKLPKDTHTHTPTSHFSSTVRWRSVFPLLVGFVVPLMRQLYLWELRSNGCFGRASVDSDKTKGSSTVCIQSGFLQSQCANGYPIIMDKGCLCPHSDHQYSRYANQSVRLESTTCQPEYRPVLHQRPRPRYLCRTVRLQSFQRDGSMDIPESTKYPLACKNLHAFI